MLRMTLIGVVTNMARYKHVNVYACSRKEVADVGDALYKVDYLR